MSDLDSYMKDISASRFERRMKRQAQMSEAAPKAKVGARGGLRGGSSAALRHPRKKKGKYFAA